jgi:hypothetical protein
LQIYNNTGNKTTVLIYFWNQEVLTVDLPAILNGRKQLDRLVLELDTAKARLERAREEEQSNSAG